MDFRTLELRKKSDSKFKAGILHPNNRDIQGKRLHCHATMQPQQVERLWTRNGPVTETST